MVGFKPNAFSRMYAGFVVDYNVVENTVLDKDLVVPVVEKLPKRFDGKMELRRPKTCRKRTNGGCLPSLRY